MTNLHRDWVLALPTLALVPGPAAAGSPARQAFSKTYPLSAHARVSLENVNGSIHIQVWARAEVKVDAVIDRQFHPRRPIGSASAATQEPHKSHSTSWTSPYLRWRTH